MVFRTKNPLKYSSKSASRLYFRYTLDNPKSRKIDNSPMMFAVNAIIPISSTSKSKTMK